MHLSKEDIAPDFDSYIAKLSRDQSLTSLLGKISFKQLKTIITDLEDEWGKSGGDFCIIQLVVALIKLKNRQGNSTPETIDIIALKLLGKYFGMENETTTERKIHYKILNYFKYAKLLAKEHVKAEYEMEYLTENHQKCILDLLYLKMCQKYCLEHENRINITYFENDNPDYGVYGMLFNCCDYYFKMYDLKSSELQEKFNNIKEVEEEEDFYEQQRIAELILLMLPYDDREIFLLRYNQNMSYNEMAKLLKLIGTGNHATSDTLRIMFNQIKNGKIVPLIRLFYDRFSESWRDHIYEKFIEQREECEYHEHLSFYSFKNTKIRFLKINKSLFYFQIMLLADQLLFQWLLFLMHPKFTDERVKTLTKSFFRLQEEEQAVIVIEKLYRHTLENLLDHCEKNTDVLRSIMPDLNHKQLLHFIASVKRLEKNRNNAISEWQNMLYN